MDGSLRTISAFRPTTVNQHHVCAKASGILCQRDSQCPRANNAKLGSIYFSHIRHQARTNPVLMRAIAMVDNCRTIPLLGGEAR